MLRRRWTRQAGDTSHTGSQKVTFYNAGDYWGEHFEDGTWVCYKVLKRERTNDGIEEELEKMYEDFVPWDVISTEEYPVLEKAGSSFVIPGWRLSFV